MKQKYKKILMILLALVLFTAGCTGCTTSSSQITPLEKADQTTEKNENKNENLSIDEMFTDGRMTLPENGIVTQNQMEAIAGTDAVYEFYSSDTEMNISYYWSYEGKKIKNPVEQNMKVTFTNDQVEDVKKAANNASVGLGVTLAKANLAAPAKLTLQLSEKWDADAVILCKLVDGIPEKMCDAQIGTWGKDKNEYTTLTFSVIEMGDTYYLVGGKTKVDNETQEDSSGAGSSPSEGIAGNPSSGGDSAGNSGNSAGTGEGGSSGSGSTGENKNTADSGSFGNSSSFGDSQNSSTGSQNSSGSSQSGNQENDSPAEETHTCKISIDCKTILNNMDDLNKAKSDFVPSDGWILYLSEVEYTPGETVYDVLYRVCRETDIHMEASYTPAYSSYYVEGINQLYEFDCGSLSGWMYSVNGWFPNYGCSQYEVSDGDVIEWRYTCDLGRDVGDQYYE